MFDLHMLLLLALLVAAGALATLTDLRTGKIYNRHLAAFAVLGAAVHTMFWRDLVGPELLRFVANLLLSLLVAFLLFYARFWAAGDAKLFLLLVFLTPFWFYPGGSLFGGFYLLMFVFGLAFLYAVTETIFYGVVDTGRPAAERRLITEGRPRFVLTPDWLLRYLAASLLLSVIYRAAAFAAPQIVARDPGLMMITGLLLLVFLYSRLRDRRLVLGIIIAAAVLLASYALLLRRPLTAILDWRGPVLALVTIILMQVVGRYDYIRIPVAELRPGLVLSAMTTTGFLLAGWPGLPVTTTETTSSRLSRAQTDNIRAWSEADPANSHVVIVAHLPFAPFIFAGAAALSVLALVAPRP